MDKMTALLGQADACDLTRQLHEGGPGLPIEDEMEAGPSSAALPPSSMLAPPAPGATKVDVNEERRSHHSRDEAAHLEKAVEKTGPAPPSRLALRFSAAWWRGLQRVGMALHYLPSPRPPTPSFVRRIPSTLSKTAGEIALLFYVPSGYHHHHNHHHHHRPLPLHHHHRKHQQRWPCVVNFHGGGFSLGAATDDARFARHVITTAGAVFVSVEYRLAPEQPFPVPVEDAADAVLWVAGHADELGLDAHRIATSGFSAGGNLALTGLLRIERERQKRMMKGADDAKASPLATASSTLSPASTASSRTLQPPAGPQDTAPLPDFTIAATVLFYPILDFTLTRAARRANCIRPDLALPATLTDLFDASYLHPRGLDLADPLLSPACASDAELEAALGKVGGGEGDREGKDAATVVLISCEFDMLCREARDFAERLRGGSVSGVDGERSNRTGSTRNVRYRMVPAVVHGWDKGPYPWTPAKGSEEVYGECAEVLKEVFGKRARRDSS